MTFVPPSCVPRPSVSRARFLVIVGVLTSTVLMHAAEPAAQPPAPPKTALRSAELMVAGWVLAGAGGWLLGTGLGETPSVTCVGLYGVVTCQETGSNRGLLIGAGAGLAGAGVALAAYGAHRITITPTVTAGVLGRRVGAFATVRF
jgi:hypothetical protein